MCKGFEGKTCYSNWLSKGRVSYEYAIQQALSNEAQEEDPKTLRGGTMCTSCHFFLHHEGYKKSPPTRIIGEN